MSTDAAPESDTAGLDRDSVEANGLTFEYLERGDGDQLALCLHGFPDDAGSMRPVLERLADAGYRAVAPYMRGYAPTEPAPDGDYTVEALGSDAVALAETLGDGDTLLVGHDWGASAAYAAGTAAPEQFDALATMAVPPLFDDDLSDYPRQLLRSWYMWFFQIPALPEWALRADDFALIDFLWSTWSPNWDYPHERIGAVKETFRTGDTVETALEYYRQVIPEAVSGDDEEEDADQRIEVPGLVIAGNEDGCVGSELFGSADSAFTGECRVVTVQGAGHFMHQERPDIVCDEILEFVG